MKAREMSIGIGPGVAKDFGHRGAARPGGSQGPGTARPTDPRLPRPSPAPGHDGPLAPGGVGRIEIGGLPGLSLFTDYLDDEGATAAAFVDRDDAGLTRLDTGDLGRLDVAGDVEFVGRGGDMLKVAGENVPVLEVEAVLLDHPAVHDAAVVSVPDLILDEVPVAFVVPAAEAPDTLAGDLASWCSERLSGPRRPREVHLVDRLPRTAAGKIQRFRLTGRAGPAVSPDR